MQKGILFVITSIILNVNINSQNNNYVDTNFIGIYPYDGGIYSYISNKSNDLSYRNTQKNYTLYYYPNTWGYWGIGAYYKWLDLSVNLYSFGKRDESLYGITSRIDLQSHIYLRKYIIDAFFQYYNSFYSNSYYLTNDSNKIYLRPDIKMFHSGINFLRIVKYNKFSVKSAFSQSEIQKKSVGTWIWGAKFNIFGISADSVFSSSILHSIFPKDYRLISFNSTQIGIKGGYMYNYKRKYWTFNITVILGLSNQFQQKVLASNIDKNYVHVTTDVTVNVRLAASYSKNRYYLIISGINDNCQYSLNNFIKLNHIFGRVDIIFGYRLFNKKNIKN